MEKFLDFVKGKAPKGKVRHGEREPDSGATVGRTLPPGTQSNQEDSILEDLRVPLPLRSRECNRLLAKSIAEAYRAVEKLSHPEPGHGGLDMNRKPVPVPMVPTYRANQFYAPNGLGEESDLRYTTRPLVPRAQCADQLKELWFGQEQTLSGDLREHGFAPRRLDEIWNGKPGGSAKPQSSVGNKEEAQDEAPQPSWQEITARIWMLLEKHQEFWMHQSIGQIGHRIYQHAYLGAPTAEQHRGRELSRSQLQRYDDELRKVCRAHSVTLPEPSNGFYQFGSATQVRFRIYVHATLTTAPSVMGKVFEMKDRQRAIVSAKIAVAEDAGQRPDTIVAYVSGERGDAERIASELRGDLRDGDLGEDIPAFTTGSSGIGMAWNPQSNTDLSFGEYMSAILAEAFFDVMASEPTPDESSYHRRVLEFFALYGLSEDVMVAAMSDAALQRPPALETPNPRFDVEEEAELEESARPPERDTRRDDGFDEVANNPPRRLPPDPRLARSSEATGGGGCKLIPTASTAPHPATPGEHASKMHATMGAKVEPSTVAEKMKVHPMSAKVGAKGQAHPTSEKVGAKGPAHPMSAKVGDQEAPKEAPKVKKISAKVAPPRGTKVVAMQRETQFPVEGFLPPQLGGTPGPPRSEQLFGAKKAIAPTTLGANAPGSKSSPPRKPPPAPPSSNPPKGPKDG
jgi:HopA1 effector protein family